MGGIQKESIVFLNLGMVMPGVVARSDWTEGCDACFLSPPAGPGPLLLRFFRPCSWGIHEKRNKRGPCPTDLRRNGFQGQSLTTEGKGTVVGEWDRPRKAKTWGRQEACNFLISSFNFLISSFNPLSWNRAGMWHLCFLITEPETSIEVLTLP